MYMQFWVVKIETLKKEVISNLIFFQATAGKKIKFTLGKNHSKNFKIKLHKCVMLSLMTAGPMIIDLKP